jgi:hypothetical protein
VNRLLEALHASTEGDLLGTQTRLLAKSGTTCIEWTK